MGQTFQQWVVPSNITRTLQVPLCVCKINPQQTNHRHNFFKHKYITQPTVTPVDAIVQAYQNLAKAINGNNNTPYRYYTYRETVIPIGVKGTYYFDATIRRDRSSSLPKDNNTYYYPSVSSSIVFSNLVDYSWLNFGKFRINYAEVGSDTDPYNVYNTYDINSGFGGNASGSNPSVFNNPNLKPEKSKDIEIGMELQTLDNRLGLDFSYYKRKTTAKQ